MILNKEIESGVGKIEGIRRGGKLCYEIDEI